MRPTDTLALMDDEVLAALFERLTGPADARRIGERLAVSTHGAAHVGARPIALRVGLAYAEGVDDTKRLVASASASMRAPRLLHAGAPFPTTAHRRRPTLRRAPCR